MQRKVERSRRNKNCRSIKIAIGRARARDPTSNTRTYSQRCVKRAVHAQQPRCEKKRSGGGRGVGANRHHEA
eukprot:3973279-Prymnesium_polylepis.1